MLINDSTRRKSKSDILNNSNTSNSSIKLDHEKILNTSNLLTELLWTKEFRPDYRLTDEDNLMLINDIDSILPSLNKNNNICNNIKKICNKKIVDNSAPVNVKFEDSIFNFSKLVLSPSHEYFAVLICDAFSDDTISDLLCISPLDVTHMASKSIQLPFDDLGRMRSLAWSHDSKLLAISSPTNREIIIFNLFGEKIFNFNLEMGRANSLLHHNWLCSLNFGNSKIENSYELFYTDETSIYKSILVKAIEHGYLGRIEESVIRNPEYIDASFSNIISQADTMEYHCVVNSMIFHPSGIIFTFGPSNVIKGLNVDIVVACWTKDLKYINSYGSHTKPSSFSLYYNGFLDESDLYGYKIRLSPDSNNLVCLNKCGELVIWKLIFGNSISEFKLEQIHSISSNVHISCNIPRSKFVYGASSSSLTLNSQGQWPNHSISDISWWNNNTLIVSLRNGRVVLSNMLKINADSLPDCEIMSAFQGVPILSNGLTERCYALECQRYYLSNKRYWSDIQSNENSMGMAQTIYTIFILVLTVRRVYRLVSICRRPPIECFYGLLVDQHYDRAEKVAKLYNLNTDPLYQAKWSESSISIKFIYSYLNKITDLAWILHTISHPSYQFANSDDDSSNSLEKLKLIFAYALLRTRKSPLLFNERNLDDFKSRSPAFMPYFEDGLNDNDLEYQQILIYRISKFNDPQCIELLIADDPVSFTRSVKSSSDIFELDLCCYRMLFLNYLYRLDTYSLIYSNLTFESILSFLDCKIEDICGQFAFEEKFAQFEILLKRHSCEISNYFNVLDKIPLICDPDKFRKFLPILKDDQAVILNVFNDLSTFIHNIGWFSVLNWMQFDFEKITCPDILQSRLNSLLANFSFIISLKQIVSKHSYSSTFTFTIEFAIDFFKSFALKIDQCCGRLDYSLKMALFAQDIQTNGMCILLSIINLALTNFIRSTIHVNKLVYDFNFSISLSIWETLSPLNKLSLVLEESTEGSIVDDLEKFGRDILVDQELLIIWLNTLAVNKYSFIEILDYKFFIPSNLYSRWATIYDPSDALLSSYLLSLGPNKMYKIRRIIAEILATKLCGIECAIACLYSFGIMDLEKCASAWKIYETIPMRVDMLNAAQNNNWLFDLVDNLGLNIKACEFAAKYNMPMELDFFRKITYKILLDFLMSTFRVLQRSSASDSIWRDLLNELKFFQKDIFNKISLKDIYEIYFKSCLYSDKINLASEVLAEVEFSSLNIEDTILNEATARINACISISSKDMNNAKEILELIPSTKNIKTELDLVKGFKLLEEFIEDQDNRINEVDLIDIIPFEFKAADSNNRCNLISDIIIKPYFLNFVSNYHLFERLLLILEYFGLNTNDNKGQIKLFAANLAYEKNKYSSAKLLLMDCIDLEYGRSWELCQKLLLSPHCDLIEVDKDKLMNFCLCYCPAPTLLSLVSRLKSEELPNEENGLPLSLNSYNEIANNIYDWKSKTTLSYLSATTKFNRFSPLDDTVKDEILIKSYFANNFKDMNVRTVADFYTSALFSRSIQSNISWIGIIANNPNNNYQHEIFAILLEISFKYFATLYQSHSNVSDINTNFFNLNVRQIIDYFKLDTLDTCVDSVYTVKSAFYQIFNMLKSSNSISEILIKHSLNENQFMNDPNYRNECIKKFILNGVDGLEIALLILDCIREPRIKIHFQYLIIHFEKIDIPEYIKKYKDELFLNPFEFDSFLILDLLPNINGAQLDLIEKWIFLRLDIVNIILNLKSPVNRLNNTVLIPFNPILNTASAVTVKLILDSSLELIKKIKNCNITIDFKCFWSSEKLNFEQSSYTLICLKNAINQNNILLFSSLISKKVEEVRKLILIDNTNDMDPSLFLLINFSNDLLTMIARGKIDANWLNGKASLFKKISIRQFLKLILMFSTASGWFSNVLINYEFILSVLDSVIKNLSSLFPNDKMVGPSLKILLNLFGMLKIIIKVKPYIKTSSKTEFYLRKFLWPYIESGLVCLLFDSISMNNLSNKSIECLSYNFNSIIADIPNFSLILQQDIDDRLEILEYLSFTDVEYVEYVKDFDLDVNMINLKTYIDSFRPNILTTFEIFLVDFFKCYINYSLHHIGVSGPYSNLPLIIDNSFESELLEIFNTRFHPLLNSSLIDYLLTTCYNTQISPYTPVFYLSKDWIAGINSKFPPLWNFSFYPVSILWIFRCLYNLFGIDEFWVKYKSSKYGDNATLELIISKLFCLQKEKKATFPETYFYFESRAISCIANLLMGLPLATYETCDDLFVAIADKYRAIVDECHLDMSGNSLHNVKAEAIKSITLLLWQCQEMDWFNSDANRESFIEDVSSLSASKNTTIVKLLNKDASDAITIDAFDNWDFDMSEDINALTPKLIVNLKSTVSEDVNKSIQTFKKKYLPSWLEGYWISLLDNYLQLLSEDIELPQHLLVIIYSRALNVVSSDEMLSFLSRCNFSISLKLKLWLLSYLHDTDFENSSIKFAKLLKDFKIEYLDNELIDLILCCDKYLLFKDFKVEEYFIKFFKYRPYGDIVSYRPLIKSDDYFLGSLLHLICCLISDHQVTIAANILRLSTSSNKSSLPDCILLKDYLLLNNESVKDTPSFELDMIELALIELKEY